MSDTKDQRLTLQLELPANLLAHLDNQADIASATVRELASINANLTTTRASHTSSTNKFASLLGAIDIALREHQEQFRYTNRILSNMQTDQNDTATAIGGILSIMAHSVVDIEKQLKKANLIATWELRLKLTPEDRKIFELELDALK